VSVSRHFLLQAPQCPCSVRRWFSIDYWRIYCINVVRETYRNKSRWNEAAKQHGRFDYWLFW